jgi:hypothetical protein
MLHKTLYKLKAGEILKSRFGPLSQIRFGRT